MKTTDMAEKNKVELLGAKELMAVLNQLPKQLNDRFLQQNNRKGAKVYQFKMISRSPSKRISSNIKIKNDKRDKTGVIVGVTNKAFHAIFLEFGTKIRKTKGGGPKQFKSASRGSMSPEPFIKPAIESATSPAINTIFKDMSKKTTSFLKRETRKINNKIKSLNK